MAKRLNWRGRREGPRTSWTARTLRNRRVRRQWVAGCGRATLGGVSATGSPEKREADALAKLTSIKATVWIASALPTGGVHLVPVSNTLERQSSCPVNGAQITGGGQRHGESAGPPRPGRDPGRGHRRSRLGRGRPGRVEAPEVLAEGYAAQAGRDPRTDPGD